ncbi:NOTC1-like protein, partial [Mya arenaria]
MMYMYKPFQLYQYGMILWFIICNCDVSYRGTLCEEPYIPCFPDPCQHGGTCLTTSAITYQCTCPP